MATVRELITKIVFRVDEKGINQAEQAVNKFKQNAQEAGSTANNSSRRASSSFRRLSGAVGKATIDLSRLRQNAQRLNSQRTTVRVNAETGQAESRLSRLRQKLRGLSSPNSINMKANISGIGSGISGTAAGLASMVGGGMILGNIKDTADEMMNLDGRLRTVTKTEQERLNIESQLYAMGQKTRQPIQSLGDLYFKVARASQEMGFQQKENLQVTETVSKALIVGGASAAEASATILQLGQALGSGRLQGDELRSLDENASILMGHIAKYFKTNVAGLKQMGAEGKLTSDEVMRAILSASKEVDKEFSKMPMTFGQSMNVMKNSWDMFILGVEQKSTVFSLIARSFTKAFDSMGKKFHDFMTLMGKPDKNKKVTITEAATGETKEISETDYYNQKAKENPGMVKAIEVLTRIENLFDRLDGKTGNLDEQLGRLFEDFMEIGLVAVPILAVIGVIDALIMLLSPFISLLTSIGGIIQGAFAPILSILQPILGAGLAPLLAILAAIASVIYFVGENWETVVSWFQPGIDSMKEGLAQLQQAWQNLQPFIAAITPLLQAIATVVGGAIVGAWSLMFRIAAWVFKQIASFINWVAGLLGDLGNTISWLADGLAGLISKAAELLGYKGKLNGLNASFTNGWLKGGGGDSYSSNDTFTFNVTRPSEVGDLLGDRRLFPGPSEYR